MVRARFALIRYIADLVRNEPTNIGVVLQTPSQLTFRLLSDFSHLRERASSADLQVLKGLHRVLPEKLLKRDQVIHDCKAGKDLRVKNTDPRFLKFLGSTYEGQVQIGPGLPCFLSEDRPGEIQALLDSLYDSMVEPVPAVRPGLTRARPRSVRALLRQSFLPLIRSGLMEEDYGVQASVLHTFPFSYGDGHRVLIEALDLDVKSGAEQLRRVQEVAFKWLDIVTVLEKEARGLRKVSVYYPPAAPGREMEGSLHILRRYSDEVCNYREEGEAFVGRVFAALGQSRGSGPVM